MTLFHILSDFRHFQDRFHHFCEMSRSWLKSYRGGGGPGPEMVLRYQLDNSEASTSTMFVRSTYFFFCDVTSEHCAKHTIPLTNYTPNISHLGVTIPCGVNAAIGIAFLLTRLHATSPITPDNMPVHLSKLF